MKKVILILFIIVALLVVSVIFSGCPGGGEKGTLRFYANGEDFVRQGFVSKDGWRINFDHVHTTLTDITAYQTDPPYDPHTGDSINGKVTVGLPDVYTVDLAEGGQDARPILVAEVGNAPAGHYNALSWKMIRAVSGPATGHRSGNGDPRPEPPSASRWG